MLDQVDSYTNLEFQELPSFLSCLWKPHCPGMERDPLLFYPMSISVEATDRGFHTSSSFIQTFGECG